MWFPWFHQLELFKFEGNSAAVINLFSSDLHSSLLIPQTDSEFLLRPSVLLNYKNKYMLTFYFKALCAASFFGLNRAYGDFHSGIGRIRKHAIKHRDQKEGGCTPSLWLLCSSSKKKNPLRVRNPYALAAHCSLSCYLISVYWLNNRPGCRIFHFG